jgi:hypothetical protein
MRPLAYFILLALWANAGQISTVAVTKPVKPPCSCTVTLPPAPVDSRGTEKSPLTVQVSQLPARTPEEIERDNAEQREKRSTDHWTIGLTVATAFILALQLVVFGIQATRLKASIDEARRATEATRLAATAAEETVATMNRTARRDLRAYVAISASSIEQVDDGGSPCARVRIKNFGKTPAYRFAASADINFYVSGADLHDPRVPSAVSGHLAPGGELDIVLNASWKLTGNQKYQIENNIAAIHVYGVITYIDTYGETRFTRYRVITDGRRSVPIGGLVSFVTGNDTDDDERIVAAAAAAAARAGARPDER